MASVAKSTGMREGYGYGSNTEIWLCMQVLASPWLQQKVLSSCLRIALDPLCATVAAVWEPASNWESVPVLQLHSENIPGNPASLAEIWKRQDVCIIFGFFVLSLCLQTDHQCKLAMCWSLAEQRKKCCSHQVITCFSPAPQQHWWNFECSWIITRVPWHRFQSFLFGAKRGLMFGPGWEQAVCTNIVFTVDIHKLILCPCINTANSLARLRWRLK